MATTCPKITVDCNPPFDWAPKQYSFYFGVSIGTESFVMPSLKDCLGRNLTPYGNQASLKTAGGANFDAVLEDDVLFSTSL